MIQYEPWSKDVVQKAAQDACNGIFTCLDLEISGKCPYNCIYCESPYRNKESTLNVEKVCTLLDTKQFKWVYICGIGEPTYEDNYVQLLKILASCKKNEARCSIFTNLSSLTEQLINYINDNVLYCVFKFDSLSEEKVIKLYSPSEVETHFLNINRIEKFVRCDGITTNIAASIVPTKYNKDEIPFLVEWCVERNIFPLVAQLEYAGAAKDVFEELVLEDDALEQLKTEIKNILGDEYSVPFCPAVFSGLSITYDNKITIDRRTGLTCHSFWLDDPDLDVICENFSELYTLDDITQKLITARTERYEDFLKNKDKYGYDVLGGCGGNKIDIFDLYTKMMEASLKQHMINERNLLISRFVYLDNNSTTRISDSVRDAMLYYFDKGFANPNSNNNLGRKTRGAIDEARLQIARSINAEPREVYFTSCGSEGNSWAIKSCLNNTARINKKIIITTEIEHDSVLDYISSLKKLNYEIVNIPIGKNGSIDINMFQNSFTHWEDVIFASVMLVNNETGVINDIKKLSSILHKYKIPLHCDAVQGLGKMCIDTKILGADYLTFSGHKVHAPKGIGAMFVKEGSYLCPLIYGHQENGIRGGTENVALIVAFGQAVKDIYSNKVTSFHERIMKIRKLRDKIETYFSASEYHSIIAGRDAERVANTLNIGFEGIDAIKLSTLLESRGIYVSNGAACNIVNPQQSHVLRAMQSPAFEYGALRISLSEYTEERDVDYFIDNLKETIKRVKGD